MTKHLTVLLFIGLIFWGCEKQQNEKKAKDEFEERVKESKRKASEENVKIAQDSGSKLTQTIKEDGSLVGVENMNTTEGALGEKELTSSADIRKELFEGDNIRRANDPVADESLFKTNEQKDEDDSKKTDE